MVSRLLGLWFPAAVLLSTKTPSSDTVADPPRMAVWLFINASESMRPTPEQQLELVPIPPAGPPLFSFSLPLGKSLCSQQQQQKVVRMTRADQTTRMTPTQNHSSHDTREDTRIQRARLFDFSDGFFHKYPFNWIELKPLLTLLSRTFLQPPRKKSILKRLAFFLKRYIAFELIFLLRQHLIACIFKDHLRISGFFVRFEGNFRPIFRPFCANFIFYDGFQRKI